MAYRRLPNTDNARIRALRKAIGKCSSFEGKQTVGVDPIRLQAILRDFETAQSHYQTSLNLQVEENKKMQDMVKSTRLYISHFIQVLNLCVIRNEIRADLKKLYGLKPHDTTLPDLMSNESLEKWGQRIIQGEQNRTAEGGAPIYNPSIARVNVEYSVFKDAYIAQKMHQNNTQRHLDELSSQRDDVDETLRQIWNSVEARYQDIPRQEMLNKCREYGVVYYIRKRNKQEASENN